MTRGLGRARRGGGVALLLCAAWGGCSAEEATSWSGIGGGAAGTGAGAGGAPGGAGGGGSGGAAGAPLGGGGSAGSAGAAGSTGSGGLAHGGSGGGGAGPTGCSDCHGSGENAAPPKDCSGQTDPALPGVGAHQRHLTTQFLYRTVECSECHVVPSAVGDPGHLGPPPAPITWGPVAGADGISPSYDGQTCVVYCHGASLQGGYVAAPRWVGGSNQAHCGACHGLPPPAPHPSVTPGRCNPCHDFDGVMPLHPQTHVDGKVDVAPCGSCHAVPPQTGAHLAHYGDSSAPPLASYGDLETVSDYLPGGAPYYVFGCGNCHPRDGALHGNGVLEVELYDPAAPAGSLKRRHPASTRYAGGRCEDVYCHSSGQEIPTFVATPAWNGGALPVDRCRACHDNPPRYPSGGAGSATANTHVAIADDGWELGHFGGLPGPWHGSYHGESIRGAAPITCQTCHYDTVDPAHTGPSGFYYLDTSGDYDLGGSLGYGCGTCHGASPLSPPVASGAVRTAKHVNGTRDVVFDARTSLPAAVMDGLPAEPNRPSRPYWVTSVPSALPPHSAVDGATWSLDLSGASYDPGQKVCASVPCHLNQSFGSPNDPLAWGASPVGWATCGVCHF